MFYTLKGGLLQLQKPFWEDCVAVLTPEELSGLPVPEGLAPPPGDLKKIRFSKAEVRAGNIRGTVRVPKKKGFAFAATRNAVLLVGEGGFAATCAERVRRACGGKPLSAGEFLCEFFNAMIRDDLERLCKIEEHLLRLESEALSGKLGEIDRHLIAFRKEIAALSHYYAQLADFADVVQEDAAAFATGEVREMLRLFSGRAGRLYEETMMLREYAMQIREVYQAQIGIRQNEIMKILTVVTSVFMPLSLVAGWYGMNFAFMPELHWKYAYPAVAGVCVLVVAACLAIFKKKKFW